MSSILQQEGDIPEIVVDIAYVKGAGDPTTKEMIDYFREQGLDIVETPHKRLRSFQYRGLLRNSQIANTDADWVLFNDADIVYPPNFFAELKKLLEGEFKDARKCIHGPKATTPLEDTNTVVDSMLYPSIIPDVYDLAKGLKPRNKRSVGAGYCQIFNVHQMRKHNDGHYVDPDNCRDKKWVPNQQAHGTRSDTQLRRRWGLEIVDLPRQIHLQHTRPYEDQR